MMQGVPNADPGVSRETVGADESLKVLNRGRAEFDASHGLEFFERDGIPRTRFVESPLCSVERAGDPI
jgi:hypothetical protein